MTGGSSIVNANSLIVHPGATLKAAGSAQVIVSNSANVNGTVDVLGGVMLVGEVPPSGTIQSGALTVTPGGILDRQRHDQGQSHRQESQRLSERPGAWIKLGNSPGLLTVEGDATIESGSMIEMEVGGLSAGTQYDKLSGAGGLRRSTAPCS